MAIHLELASYDGAHRTAPAEQEDPQVLTVVRFAHRHHFQFAIA